MMSRTCCRCSGGGTDTPLAAWLADPSASLMAGASRRCRASGSAGPAPPFCKHSGGGGGQWWRPLCKRQVAFDGMPVGLPPLAMHSKLRRSR